MAKTGNWREKLTLWLAECQKNDHGMDHEYVHNCWLARRPLKTDLILGLRLQTVDTFHGYRNPSPVLAHASVHTVTRNTKMETTMQCRILFILFSCFTTKCAEYIWCSKKNPYAMSAGYIRRNTPCLHCCVAIGIFHLESMYYFAL